ncbi:MAG: CPBP family intramembrane glutamic endopeptidase [Rudaea sp.]
MSIKNKGIVVFLLFAFGLAWIPLLIQYVLGMQPVGRDATLVDYVVFTLLNLPTAFAPAIGALVVRKWVTREGWADAGLGLNLRRAWRYYLFALAYPLLLVPLTLLLAWTVGGTRPAAPALALTSILQLPLMALISTPIIWGEEFGWRGYLQLRLFPERPFWAAVGTGLIWGVWHYPMILLGYLFYGDPLGLILYPVNMIFTSMLYGWFRTASGSVWTASLAHSSGNTIITPLLGMLLPGLAWPLVWGGYRLVALAILCGWIILQPRGVPLSQARSELSRIE